MSTFNTPWFNSQDHSFFNKLNISKVKHVIVTGETEDFAEEVLDQWRDAGFDTHYAPLLEGGREYIARLKQMGESMGVGESYAFVAFGDAAALVLEGHIKPTSPRLVAIAAYYPPYIPDPHTKFPPSTRVVVHLTGREIDVKRHPEVLGIQANKTKTVRKRVDPGAGYGGCLKLGFKAYTYEECESGFAEHDLDEWDPVSEQLAFSRSVAVLKRAFRVEEDIELVRDDIVDAAVRGNSEKVMKNVDEFGHVINAPSLVGGVGAQDLQHFYTKLFHPLPPTYNSKLVSRTIGADRVVDELFISFTHSQPVPWILPGIPASGKKVEIMIVSIACIRDNKMESEHIYWDQASVLSQIGLLDPKNVSGEWKKKGVKQLPVASAEGSKAIKRGSSKLLNKLLDSIMPNGK